MVRKSSVILNLTLTISRDWGLQNCLSLGTGMKKTINQTFQTVWGQFMNRPHRIEWQIFLNLNHNVSKRFEANWEIVGDASFIERVARLFSGREMKRQG